MGRKNQDKQQEEQKEEEKPEEEKPEEEKPEDTPIIKELKVIDDKYLALEKEYDKEAAKLRILYTEKQAPFLVERKDVLCRDNSTTCGTPTVPSFWRTAMKNHPAFEDAIEEWDEPVLEYCQDITYEENADCNTGFKLTFHFIENPYFENKTLEKEYVSIEENPYNGDISMKEIKTTTIDWKSGKDVTVEKTSKKVKGGGAKKSKQKGKEKEEPRESLFRNFFRNMKEGMDLPDDVTPDMLEMMGDEDEDEDGLVDMLMENDHEMGSALKDVIIPFAVRWYTGEAAPERDDDDDEDSEEEDDDDDESSEDPAPKKKGGKAPKKSPGNKPAADPKQEECKQQ